MARRRGLAARCGGVIVLLAGLPAMAAPPAVCPSGAAVPRALLAGDSWAQLMWDDGSHNALFNKFGHADKRMISRSLGSDPGAGYGGPEYAVSGSEARHFLIAP